MYTADARMVPWLASQTDILAEDWEILGSHQDQDLGAIETVS